MHFIFPFRLASLPSPWRSGSGLENVVSDGKPQCHQSDRTMLTVFPPQQEVQMVQITTDLEHASEPCPWKSDVVSGQIITHRPG